MAPGLVAALAAACAARLVAQATGDQAGDHAQVSGAHVRATPSGARPGAASPAPGRGIVLENAATGAALHVPLRPGETFRVVSRHSMYDAPVTEEFRVEDGAIALVAVSSPSAAVREYFGLTGPGERHPVRRVLPAIVFRVATGAPQRLSAGGAERSFLDVGAHGDRLVLRVAGEP